MNTRVIADRPWRVVRQNAFSVSRTMLINASLTMAVILSAFALIYVKDLNRRLFIQYQNLQQAQAQEMSRFSKLLLEQSTWSTQARVQRIAQQDLGMQLPTTANTVLVTE